MTKRADSARLDSTSQCVVDAVSYAKYWQNKVVTEAVEFALKTTTYSGPERRANAHDRRFYNGQGGRRRFDRKS